MGIEPTTHCLQGNIAKALEHATPFTNFLSFSVVGIGIAISASGLDGSRTHYVITRLIDSEVHQPLYAQTILLRMAWESNP